MGRATVLKPEGPRFESHSFPSLNQKYIGLLKLVGYHLLIADYLTLCKFDLIKYYKKGKNLIEKKKKMRTQFLRNGLLRRSAQ